MSTKAEAVILSRVSSREQEVDGYSLPAQQKLLSEYCERKGIKINKPFSISESATKSSQRKTFQEMMAYISAKRLNILIVEKVDRLVRNFKDTVLIDDWLEADENRQVHFVKDSLILHKHARSQEKLNWGMRVVIAKNYIDNLKEEVEKGQKEKLAQGWLPSSPPIGYKTIGEEGKRVHIIDDKVSPLVKKLFELYLDPSHSLSTVTIEMKNLGLMTSHGRPLVRSHIAKVLRHPFYIGKNLWMGQLYEGKQETFITNQLFEAVQDKLTNKNAPKNRRHNPVFKGMFKCNGCGGTITWEQQRGHWYGHCNRYRDCPKKTWAREDEVEKELLAHFKRFSAPSPALVDWVRDELRKRHTRDMEAHTASLNQLKRRHSDITRRLDVLYEDRLDGRISTWKYDELVKKYSDEQKELTSRINDFDKSYIANLERNLNILELSQKAVEIYQSKPAPEDRRRLLAQIFSNLTLNGKTLGWEYTQTISAISKRAKMNRNIKETFEPDVNGFPKEKEEFITASRAIWLGR